VPKYKIHLSSVGKLITTLEVMAPSQKEAEDKAFSSLPFIEWTVEDIEPDETFIVSVENMDDPLNYI
jgi:hypothetical protein